MSSLSTVQVLKKSLSKHVSAWSEGSSEGDGDKGAASSSSSHADVDSSSAAMSDLLDRLDECEMTLDILTETLVGTVVSKLKSHPTLGSKAKSLIKKWKAVAKASEGSAAGTANTSTGAAAVTTATKAPVTSSTGGPPPKRPSTASAPAAPAPKKRNSSMISASGKTTTTSAAPPPSSSRLDRRESAASVSSRMDDDDDNDPSSYWNHLPEQRQNVCQKLHSVLLLAVPRLLADSKKGDDGSGIHADAVPHLVGQRSAEIEEAVYELFPHNAKSYADKARSLAFNLKKNVELSASLILGGDDAAGISAHEVVNMTSEQLASDAVRSERAKEAQKVIDSKRLDWEQANEDKINEMCGIKGELLKASLFTCSRCKSTKTTSTQKQTRSADEPMTVFVLCMNCGKRWKC